MRRENQLLRRGFVLAGGKSSRMGADKAWLDFDGQTLIARALGVLKAACGSAMVVSDPARFENLEPVVTDVFKGCGPLAGIHAALVHSPAELNAMLAVDMPFVSADLVRFLLSAAEDSGAVITVPRTGSGFQPLCAVYRQEFASTAEQSLRAGNYKIDSAFTRLPLRIIEEPELVAAGFSERSFFNVNTPEDRQAAAEMVAKLKGRLRFPS